MKKTLFGSTSLLFVLTALYPVGVLITACFGYTFQLVSISAFAVVITVLSIGTAVLHLIFKDTLENRTLRILSVMIAPLSLINAMLYILECPQAWMIASVVVSAGCCCCLTVKSGRPLALKIVALILSALMVVPLGFIGVFALIFGNFAQNTVVQTVMSPHETYYAQVIDSDQGALGGDTLVDVYENRGIDAFLFKIEKKPQRVYVGDWGEYQHMQIYWKDDGCLVINSTEYVVKSNQRRPSQAQNGVRTAQ